MRFNDVQCRPSFYKCIAGLFVSQISSEEGGRISKGVHICSSIIDFHIVYRQSPLGPVDLSFRALSGRLKFTVRRHKFNERFSLFRAFTSCR